MNTKTKLTRLVLAASLGSVIWAGCSTTDSRYTSMTHRDLDSASIASAPVDQSKRRPDTHPELRTGLWQFTYRNTQSLVETTTVPAAEVGQAADTTALLASSPEVLNAVGATGVAESRTSISEAAGAAPESTVIIDTKPGTKVEIK